MNETGIIWTEFTWNPFSGCEKVSTGCRFGYAETIAEKYRTTPAFPNGFGLTLRPHRLKDPFKLKAPSMIFVNSMSDFAWEAVSDDFRDRIVDVMAATPQHQYQVLTPENMLRYSRRRQLPAISGRGVSVESTQFCTRIDVLREVEVPIRFISAEPLLEDITPALNLEGIRWLIGGGESGNHLFDPDMNERRGMTRFENGRWRPRADRVDWARHLRDACLAAKTAFLWKQWGGQQPKSAGNLLDDKQWLEYPRSLQGEKWMETTPQSGRDDERANVAQGVR